VVHYSYDNIRPRSYSHPNGEGEITGFRDTRVDCVSDLQGSTATSGYKVTLEKLKIRSLETEGDARVVGVDGDLSVQ
jgi:hypothetical protein